MQTFFTRLLFVLCFVSGLAVAQERITPQHGGDTETVHVTVAASNSPGKAKADIVCSGTSDEVCIAGAIYTYCSNPVASCKVLLLDGIYYISATLNIDKSWVTLSGENHCMWNGFTGGWWQGTSYSISPLPIGCTQLRATAGGYNLLNIGPLIPTSGETDLSREKGVEITQLYFSGYNYANAYGVYENAGCDNCRIIDNGFQKLQNGIYSLMDTPEIASNNFQDIANDAMDIYGPYSRVHDNICYDIGGVCAASYGNGTGIVNNALGDATTCAYIAGPHNRVIGNNCSAFGTNFVHIAKAVRGTVIADNVANNYDASAGFVAANLVSLSSDAIYAEPGTFGTTITGNNIDTRFSQTSYAINLMGSQGGTVTGNTALGVWNSGGNAFNAGASTVLANNFSGATAGFTLAAQYLASNITGVTNNTAITTWPDSSGSGYDLTVAAGGPKYESSSTIHSGPAVRFSGADVLQSTAFSLVDNSAWTDFIVVQFSSLPSSANNTLIDSLDYQHRVALTQDNLSRKIVEYAGSYDPETAATTTGTTYVIELSSNGASSRISINGTVVSTNVGTMSWITGLTVGADYDHTHNFLYGDVAEVRIYNSAATASQGQTVGAALCTTYGVTCGSSW